MSHSIVISYQPNVIRLSKALETDDLLGAVQRGHAEVNDALGYVLVTILKWLGIDKLGLKLRTTLMGRDPGSLLTSYAA